MYRLRLQKSLASFLIPAIVIVVTITLSLINVSALFAPTAATPIVYIRIVVCAPVILYTGYYFTKSIIKNTPKVSLGDNTLQIGKNTVALHTISNVVLTEKLPLTVGFIPFTNYGILIILNNKQTIHLYDYAYKNIDALKLYLHENVLKQQLLPYERYKKILYATIDIRKPKAYKGYLLLCFPGILSILFTLYILLIVGEIKILPVKFLLLSSVVGFNFLISQSLFYFCVTNDYLIIKNHLFWWRKKVYSFNMICEISFELQEGKGAPLKSIRITTKDFKTYTYSAMSLKNKTWQAFKEDLTDKNINTKSDF